jgi:hypothetical protein
MRRLAALSRGALCCGAAHVHGRLPLPAVLHLIGGDRVGRRHVLLALGLC